MPYINVRILSGATTTQKRAVIRDLTHSMVKRLGKSPEHIHIVIDEVAPENWGFAGSLTSDLNLPTAAHPGKRPRYHRSAALRGRPALLRRS